MIYSFNVFFCCYNLQILSSDLGGKPEFFCLQFEEEIKLGAVVSMIPIFYISEGEGDRQKYIKNDRHCALQSH